MSIITTENLGLSFGAFDVFRGISVTIANDSKIGMIGPNGIGKTSLMLLMAGYEKPDTGKVHIARGRKLGYLRQEAVTAFANRDNTVYAEMETVFAHLKAQQVQLHKMEMEMSQGDFSQTLLEKYGRLQENFERDGGYDYDVHIQQTLDGLGLKREHWDMHLNHLSGGQKTRALLARLLLEKPDLLMLDEPTNHLDIEAVEWLERTLQEWQGAVLIVSHDRYFLDNVVNTVWEMNRSGIETYSGNYSAYLLQRQERWEYYERAFKEEKARLLKQVDFIQRNWVRESTHARALGLLRRVSRELAAIEKHGIMVLRSGKKWSQMGVRSERPLSVTEAIRQVNALRFEAQRPPDIRPRLTARQRSGNDVLQTKNVSFGYDGQELFSADDIDFKRGECAVLIGPNGSGKTTFLKGLLGKLDPLEGSVRLGASLKIGYFAQAHETLKGDHSVLDEIIEHKPMLPEEARTYLGQYLFSGDDVFKPVNALSGGERARLALAILSLDGANFLLLDEPTNHLDIPAREVLQEVLENYSGTILLVSHDRYLVNRLASQIWELRNGSLQVFEGTYREYVLHKAARNASTSSHQILLQPRPVLRGQNKEERKRIQSLELVEERIRKQELAIQKLVKKMEKSGEVRAYSQLNQLSFKVAQAQNELDDLMTEWEKLVA